MKLQLRSNGFSHFSVCSSLFSLSEHSWTYPSELHVAPSAPSFPARHQVMQNFQAIQLRLYWFSFALAAFDELSTLEIFTNSAFSLLKFHAGLATFFCQSVGIFHGKFHGKSHRFWCHGSGGYGSMVPCYDG